jgi:hypothetical protein
MTAANQPLPHQPIVPDGVHTLVQPPKPAVPNPLRDSTVSQPNIDQLCARDHTPLPLGKPSQKG